MSARVRKIDKGSVLDIGGLGMADDALMAGPLSHMMEPKLDRPIIRVGLSNIRQESPFQTRQDVFDPKVHPEDEELLESVQANGVLEPIMVLDVSSAGGSLDYQIVFGHRRVAAESEHPSMVKTMQGLTRLQAQAIRAMVECGTAPQDAIQTVRQPEAGQHASHARPTEPLVSPENHEGARDTPAQLTPLPSLSDRKAIEDITDLTGAPKAKIKRLIELARNAHVGLDVLAYACLYGGSREEEGEALQLAKLTRQDSRTRRLMDRYLRLRESARKQIKAIDDPRKVKFVNRVILGQ